MKELFINPKALRNYFVSTPDAQAGILTRAYAKMSKYVMVYGGETKPSDEAKYTKKSSVGLYEGEIALLKAINWINNNSTELVTNRKFHWNEDDPSTVQEIALCLYTGLYQMANPESIAQ